MKRWIRWASKLYPREWRDRYSEEFEALLEDADNGWRQFGDVVKGALAMQISRGNSWKLAVVMAASGAALSLLGSFAVARRYDSVAVVRLAPERANDPMTTIDNDVPSRLWGITEEALSRRNLMALIEKFGLYEEEPQDQNTSGCGQANESGHSNDARRFCHRGFVRILRSAESAGGRRCDRGCNAASSERSQSAAAGHTIGVLERDLAERAPANEPAADGSIETRRFAGETARRAAAAHHGLRVVDRRRARCSGLSAQGTIEIGVARGCFRDGRRRVGVRGIVSFTGAVHLARDAGFQPAVFPFRELSAAERLGEIEAKINSDATLEEIIFRLHLYSGELTKKPVPEVVRQMHANLRFEKLHPPLSRPDAPQDIGIAFTHPDPYRAQEAVRELTKQAEDYDAARMQKFIKMRAENDRARLIVEHKFAENLRILDQPTLPTTSDGARHTNWTAGGLGFGILLGCLRPFRFRAKSVSDPSNNCGQK